MRFLDRRDAGRQLAAKLAGYADDPKVLVLGLPRGGVPVAYEVARALHAPLDVFVVRKLGVPGHRELAMGAIASGGLRVLNPDVIEALGISPAAVESVADKELLELERQQRTYRGNAPLPELCGPHDHRSGRRVGHRIHDASRGRSAAAEQSSAYYRCRARGCGRNRAPPSGGSRSRGLPERAARFSRRQHVVRGFFADQRRRGAQACWKPPVAHGIAISLRKGSWAMLDKQSNTCR